MTPRKFASSVSVVLFLTISGMLLFRDQSEWIKNFGVGTTLLLGLAAVCSVWRGDQANRRASLQAKFSKMIRHDNAR